MPNSDNTFGTHNKQTKIISQIDDGSTILTVFADVAAAKAFFFTDEALAVMDECCTILEWALVNDGNGEATALKRTFAFGTKGDPNIASEDDWAGQYLSRMEQLRNRNDGSWCPVRLDDLDKWIGVKSVDSDDHIV